MHDDQNATPAAQPPRRRRLAVATAAGIAGLVLGVTGVASAQTATPTPAPSAGESAAQPDDEDCPEDKVGDSGTASGATTPEATSDAV